MTITWADVIALAPELATLPVSVQNAILALVQVMIHSCPWGDKYRQALILLAAHFGTLALRNASGATGAVVKERVGQVERQYGVSAMTSKGGLDQTIYGQMYEMLRAGLLGSRGPLVT